MRVALFLGAGASVPFGKPTTVQIKEKLYNYSSESLNDDILQSFLQNHKYPDIEYVLQAIRDIIKFSSSKGGDYFFTQEKNGMFVYKHGTIPFDTFVLRIKEVEKILENAVYENYRWKHDDDVDQTLLKIYDTIFSTWKKFSNSITVFTTNYDRVIEEYCNLAKGYRCIDGYIRDLPHSEISKWSGSYDLKNEEGITDIHLYKIHGSLNWKVHVKHGMIKTNEEGKPTDSNYHRNLLILPTLSPKDEEDDTPFSEIIEKFEDYMNDADACIVIGFSFRDIGINNVFKKFIDKGKALIVISPSGMENVCENLLKVSLPENFTKDKMSSLAPSNGNVWCISHPLQSNNIHTHMDLAFVHIDAILKKLQSM